MILSSFELLLSLHICDSNLPVGSLSHSSGLESAVKSGIVNSNVESLRKFVILSFEQIISQYLPLLEVSHSISIFHKKNTELLIKNYREVDRLCNLVLSSNEVAHRASHMQGIFEK